MEMPASAKEKPHALPSEGPWMTELNSERAKQLQQWIAGNTEGSWPQGRLQKVLGPSGPPTNELMDPSQLLKFIY